MFHRIAIIALAAVLAGPKQVTLKATGTAKIEDSVVVTPKSWTIAKSAAETDALRKLGEQMVALKMDSAQIREAFGRAEVTGRRTRLDKKQTEVDMQVVVTVQ